MTTPQPEQPSSLRPFFTLWTGQAISLLGSQLVQFALIWWLTQQTGSATVLATASIVGLLPQVLIGPFAGVLVDRWNRRRVMLGADAIVALATLALVYFFWAGAIQIWYVYVALFIRALAGSFHSTAMTASTSLMVPQEQLTRIQGLNQVLNGGLNIAAAPLAALLLAVLPIQGVLLVDILTAALAITTILLVAVPQPQRHVSAGEAQSTLGAYWHDLRAGLRYVLGWPGLLLISGIAMAINLVLAPTTSLMPLLVTEHFQGTAWHLSALEAGFGIGVLLGGLLLGVWGGFRSRIMTSLLGVAGIGMGILLVGLAPVSLFPLAVFGMLFGGMMSSLANGPLLAILQASVAPGMQGRVFTLLSSAAMAMMPLGLAIAGPMAEVIGVRSWFLIGGVATILIACVCMFVPTVRNVERDRDDHPDRNEAMDIQPSITTL